MPVCARMPLCCHSAHNENWARKFEEEAVALRRIFGDNVVRFEHFGSTRVPGLPAKPVIDMMCIVHSLAAIDACNDQMTALGYDVAGEWGIPGRRLFRKGGDDRTHHIHVYEVGNRQIHRHLVVRDYLRTHPDEVEQYRRFKEALAQQWDDTKDYSPTKKPYVQGLGEQETG